MAFYTRQCDQCGKSYTGHGKHFCSTACHGASLRRHPATLICEHCKKEYPTPYNKASQAFNVTRFCGVECAKEAQRTWYIDKWGYRCTSRHVNGHQVQCYEHREVMEKMIGRKLLPTETVHHKNANRLDNRPENLELWTGRHGKGARLQDRIADAVRLLAENGFKAGFSINEFAAGVALGG